MIYIDRGEPSEELTEVFSKIFADEAWKSISPTDSKALRNYFDRIEKFGAKRIIRNDLIETQHYLCAYCMCKITLANAYGTTVKIEHYRPIDHTQNPNCKDDTYNYDNYFLVCLGGEPEPTSSNNSNSEQSSTLDTTRKKKKRILCCDSKKGNKRITINPTNPTHISNIQYRSDGVILYSNPKNPEETKQIQSDLNETLRLNGRWDPKKQECTLDTDTNIVSGRRSAYESAEQIVQDLIDEERCTEAELKTQISIIQSEHRPFEGVYIYVLQQYINMGLENATLPVAEATTVQN